MVVRTSRNFIELNKENSGGKIWVNVADIVEVKDDTAGAQIKVARHSTTGGTISFNVTELPEEIVGA